MKILIISDYYQPIIGYAKVHIAKQLLKDGHEVRVLTSDRYFPFPDYKNTVSSVLGNRIKPIGFKIENGIPVERKKGFIEFFNRCLFFGINEKIKSYNPDIVLLFGACSFSAIQVAMAKKNKRFKLVSVDTHLPSEFNRGNPFLKNIFYGLFRLFFSSLLNKAIDKVIGLQEDTRIIIKKYYGINKKFHLIDQGTDIERFRFSRKERNILREKYKLAKNDFLILYVGKIIPAKGVQILFEAFEQLAREYEDIYLSIVGSGDINYIKQCFSKLSKIYHKRVICVNFQSEDNLYKYYSFADVAVWPLQDSLSMNDAASCSRPFIANDKLGAKTRVSNNNALLYEQGDSNNLVKKIEYLYKNPKIRMRMGKNGRSLVENKLSWKKLSEEYIRV